MNEDKINHIKMNELVDLAFLEIDEKLFSQAENHFRSALNHGDCFNIRFGLSICLLDLYVKSGNQEYLEEGLNNAKQAEQFYRGHEQLQALISKFEEEKRRFL